MAWGAAIGAIGGALISSQSASDQADAMEGATEEQMALMREKFDYARNLQEALLEEQAPRRRAAQGATRSLAMMAGLEDPGGPGGGGVGGGTGSPLGNLDERRRLQSLRDQFRDTSPTLRTGSGTGELEEMSNEELVSQARELGISPDEYVIETGSGPRDTPTQYNREGLVSRIAASGIETRENPEFNRLEEEIASLESELQGGAGGGGTGTGGDFAGPQDVTEMPGYQFAVDQGQEALASSGAARGMQLSGNQMQDITEFGQGTAMKFRGQLIDQLAQVAGMRPSGAVAQNMAQTAVSEGQNISGLLGQMGQIGAARSAGQWGAAGSAVANMPWDQMFSGNTGTNTTSGSGFQSTQGVASATPRTF